MDLNNINNEYNMFKADLAIKNIVVKAINDDIKDLKDDKVIAQGELAKARRAKDAVEIAKWEAELKKINKDLGDKLNDLNAKKREAATYQKLVDDRIAEIRQDPQMQEHFDLVLKKQYARRVKAVLAEKEINEKKFEKAGKLEELARKSPALANNIKGMMEYCALKAELKALYVKEKDPSTGKMVEICTDPARETAIKTRMATLKAKYDLNKDNLMGYVTKKGIDLSLDDVEEFVGMLGNKKYQVERQVDPSTKELDVAGSLHRVTKHFDRQINGNIKEINNNRLELNSLGGQDLIHDDGTIDVTGGAPAGPATGTPAPATPEPPLKWYNFVKRFKKWREDRRTARLGAGSGTPAPTTGTPAPTNPTNDYTQSLKYDVVRAALETRNKEEIQKGKADRKLFEREDNDAR